jgi:hypothetical protein
MDYAKPTVDDAGLPVLANPGTKVPRISYGPNGNYERITDVWVQDGSYLKLKNVSVSYSVPNKLLAKTKVIRGIRATMSGQNLATLTNYKGYDPEVGAYVGRDASSNNQAIGLDYGRYPLTPMYTFAINVNF